MLPSLFLEIRRHTALPRGGTIGSRAQSSFRGAELRGIVVRLRCSPTSTKGKHRDGIQNEVFAIS